MKNFSKKQFHSFLCVILIITLTVTALCSCSAVKDKNSANSTISSEEQTETLLPDNDETTDSTNSTDTTEKDETSDTQDETTETLKPDGDTSTESTKPSKPEETTPNKPSNDKTEESKPTETTPSKPKDEDKETETSKPTENTKPTTHTHSYTKKTTAPTCTKKGYTTYTCSCGDSYVADYTNQTAHNHTLKSTTKATCTADGKKNYECSCGDKYSETIKATGHSWGNWKTIKEPTTSAEGTSQRKCNNCSVTESKPIAKLPAESQDSVVTQTQLKQIEDGFLMLVNLERNRVGASSLAVNSHLETVAQIRSSEIISTWSHTRPNGQPYYSLVDSNTYPYIIVGENICMTSHVGNGYYTDADKWTGSATQIEAAYSWIYYCFRNSPTHYSNMIDTDFENCGIGISYKIDKDSGLPMFYVSHIFGTK